MQGLSFVDLLSLLIILHILWDAIHIFTFLMFLAKKCQDHGSDILTSHVELNLFALQ